MNALKRDEDVKYLLDGLARAALEFSSTGPAAPPIVPDPANAYWLSALKALVTALTAGPVTLDAAGTVSSAVRDQATLIVQCADDAAACKIESCSDILGSCI